MDRRELLKLGVAAATVSVAAPATALAQAQYPDRPIRVVVPFAPGGVVDAIGRLWAEKMQPVLGTFVVENRGGASGTIGAAEVARATPDGYTMLLGNTSTQVLNPAIMPNPPYDAAKDFAPIGIIANSAISIAVNPSFPARTLPELIAYAKSNPDKVSYGSAGAGTFTNLAGEMFKQRAGLPTLTHIPYKGGGPATTDVVSGHIPMMMINITNQILELHKTGKIRIIAVFNPQRLAMIPEVPAATELLPGLIAALFIGLFAPAATPKWILDRVAAANRRAMESEDLKRKLVDAGFEPMLDTPQEAQRFMAAEYERIVPLVKALDFKLQ